MKELDLSGFMADLVEASEQLKTLNPEDPRLKMFDALFGEDPEEMKSANAWLRRNFAPEFTEEVFATEYVEVDGEPRMPFTIACERLFASIRQTLSTRRSPPSVG